MDPTLVLSLHPPQHLAGFGPSQAAPPLKGETWTPCCPYLSTIVAGGTIGPTGTCRAGRPLHTTLAGEASLALEGKDRVCDGGSRNRPRFRASL